MTHDELQAMLSADEEHWWYRGRRRVLRAAIEQLPLGPDARLLDAGCGSGRTLDELARYGRVSGVLGLTPPVLNGVLEWPLRLESRLLAGGARLPAGLSLLAILRRPAVRVAVTA